MKKAVKSHLESKWSICSFLLSGSLLTLVGELNLPSHFYSYNLLGSFAPSLYLGFILLGIALVLALQSEGDNYALSLLSLAVLFLVLYAIPYILAGSEVWNAYNFLGQDASIVRQGRLSPNLFPFEYYPASFVFYSEFIAISGISSASVVLGIFQVGWQVLFGLMIFVITKVLSGSRKTSIFSAWIFLLADYLDLAALWDQAYGFFLVLFGLLVVFLIMRRSGSRYSLVASLALIRFAHSVCLVRFTALYCPLDTNESIQEIVRHWHPRFWCLEC
jgi:hypothetical protein